MVVVVVLTSSGKNLWCDEISVCFLKEIFLFSFVTIHMYHLMKGNKEKKHTKYKVDKKNMVSFTFSFSSFCVQKIYILRG